MFKTEWPDQSSSGVPINNVSRDLRPAAEVQGESLSFAILTTSVSARF